MRDKFLFRCKYQEEEEERETSEGSNHKFGLPFYLKAIPRTIRSPTHYRKAKMIWL